MFGRAWLVALCACGLGCGSASGGSTTSGDTGSAATSGSTGSGTAATTFSDPPACEASVQCEAGFCVAPYDAGAGPGVAGRGPAACVPACVPTQALDRWCIDDAACCANLTCDPVDGLCRDVGATTGSSTGLDDWGTISGDTTATGSSGDTTAGVGGDATVGTSTGTALGASSTGG